MLKKWTSVLLLLVMGAHASEAFAQAPADSTGAPAVSSQATPPPQTTPPSQAAPSTESQTTPPAQPAEDVNACIERGRNDGKHASTGGSFVGGFAGGLFLGIIGAGIAYAVQGEPEPPTVSKYNTAGGDAQCRMAYADAFGEEGKKKKKSAALTGGIVGTAALVGILLIASSGSDSGY